MAELSERIQTGDWKAEKHVPVIECPDAVRANDFFEVSVSLGKAVAHPNTTEHHIRWMALFFQPDGEKAPYQVAHVEFGAHGESTKGANQGPVYTNHATFDVGTKSPTDTSADFDTAHLTNIFESGPYLHDGRAATLEETWTRHNSEDKHGLSSDWTKQQLNDLIEYLKSL